MSLVYLKEVVNAVSSKGQTIEEFCKRIAVRNELKDSQSVNPQSVKRCLDYLLRKGTVDIAWEKRSILGREADIMTYMANDRFERSDEFRKYCETEDSVTMQA